MSGYFDYEAQCCPHCAGYLPDTTNPEKSWEAKPPMRCYRCDTLIQRQEDYKEQRRPEALVVWDVQEKHKH